MVQIVHRQKDGHQGDRLCRRRQGSILSRMRRALLLVLLAELRPTRRRWLRFVLLLRKLRATTRRRIKKRRVQNKCRLLFLFSIQTNFFKKNEKNDERFNSRGNRKIFLRHQEGPHVDSNVRLVFKLNQHNHGRVDIFATESDIDSLAIEALSILTALKYSQTILVYLPNAQI